MYKRILAICIATAAFAISWAAANAGTASDPVISQSYLEETFLENLIDETAQKIESKLDSKIQKLNEVYNAQEQKINKNEILASASEIALEELQARNRFWYTGNGASVDIAQGQVVCGDAGTKITVLSGAGKIYGNPVVNITAGYEYPAGSSVLKNNSYFFTANDGSGILFDTPAQVIISGRYKTLASVRAPRYTDLAEALNKMGLVRGATNGFELYRGATRAEAVTMLIRLLNEEDIANKGNLTHHFTDVDAWADNIVAYALYKGYANGVAANKFGASSPTTVNHYMTFILRALGYDDTAGDFKWDSAMESAVKYGVITENERLWISATPFYRDHMVYLSYYALQANMKGKNQTLLESLIERGAVNSTKAKNAIDSVTRIRE